MEKIYSSTSLRNAEKNYDGIDLMGKAAKGILSHIKPFLNGESLLIICGSGNNGGDGWAVASMLPYDRTIVIYTDEPKTKESIFYREKYKGLSISAKDKKAEEIILNSKFILDCIFGIGLNRPAEDIHKKIIDTINRSGAFIFSADLPSGLSSKEGEDFPHVNASETICITSKKLSSVITPTKEAYGNVTVCNIDVSMENEIPISYLSGDYLLKELPPRPSNSHKGTFGTLKTLCGSNNMTGAGILAISAALRSGVGLVKSFGDTMLLDVFKVRLSEPIYKEYSKESFISEKSSAVLIGCGIGNTYDDDLRDILTNTKGTIILDADGINYLSRNIDICEHISANLILTPHPKEMSRLCNLPLSHVQNHRFSLCQRVADELNCTVVLKGEGTIICTKGATPIINTSGNSGLAKGGSGDVLAGIIAGFSAEGVSPHYSAALGAYLHGLAGDSLKQKLSEYSYLPSDIPLEIGKILADKLR